MGCCKLLLALQTYYTYIESNFLLLHALWSVPRQKYSYGSSRWGHGVGQFIVFIHVLTSYVFNSSMAKVQTYTKHLCNVTTKRDHL